MQQQWWRQLATIPPDVERIVKPVKHTIMTKHRNRRGCSFQAP